MRMKNRIAVVTGAASGMGLCIAKRFLNEGAKVLGFSLEETCEISHENFIYFSGDITKLEHCENAIKKCIEEFGGLDSLVNCAGITREGTLETTNTDVFDLVFKINVNGTFNICKAAIEELKKTKSTIVNISSNMGAKPLKERIAYNPSKAAVNMITECIALDYAPMVRANTVMPGIVRTPMIEKRLNEIDNKEELLKIYKSLYPLDRIGTTKDIEDAVLFLSTDESSWITGCHMPVCGGDQL